MSVRVHPLLLFSLITTSLILRLTNSSTDSFLYRGCSQVKYSPGSPYESNVNLLLSSLVSSATSAPFNEFKLSVPTDVVYGLFQCRGDLSMSDCRGCVEHAVGQLSTLCVDTLGGALQLDGCFVKYDNVSFFGTQDKSVVMKRCGPPIGVDSEALTRRDALLDSLASGGSQYYRVVGSGNFHSIAQCVQDLSTGECQDCVSDAIGQLKSECGLATWGDVFLGKCYARFSEKGSYNDNGNGSEDEVEKTLAILVGLIAGVALLVVFLSIISRALDRKGGK